jgi:hypothetical protein
VGQSFVALLINAKKKAKQENNNSCTVTARSSVLDVGRIVPGYITKGIRMQKRAGIACVPVLLIGIRKTTVTRLQNRPLLNRKETASGAM